MHDFSLTPQVKLPVVESIHSQSNKFAIGKENKGTGDSKVNDSPVGMYIATSLSVVLSNASCLPPAL